MKRVNLLHTPHEKELPTKYELDKIWWLIDHQPAKTLDGGAKWEDSMIEHKRFFIWRCEVLCARRSKLLCKDVRIVISKHLFSMRKP